jgi:uncharacterized protein YjdB
VTVPRALAGAVLAGVLAGALGCMNDAPLAAADATAGLTFSANVVGSAAGRTIEIAVLYHRAGGAAVRVPAQPDRVTLEPGTTVQQAVTVDLAGCLKDADRVPKNTPGCQLTVELRLVDEGGNTVDVQTKDAPGAPTAPGQVIEFGTVTIGIQVGSVDVSPGSARLTVTQTQQLAAVVKDTRGGTVTNASVSWVSSDPSVAQLSATTGAGVTVTALRLGAATITASSGGKTSPPVPVTVAPLDPLVISPASASVEAGTTLQLTVASPPGPVSWQSSDPTIASVDQTGLVRGVQARESNPVTITATSGSGPTQRTGAAQVTVTAAPPLVITQEPGPGCVIVGQTLTLGVASPPAAVTWAIDNPVLLTGNATGNATLVVTGLSAGQATIRAASANRSGTIAVCVVGPLGNVPATLAITAGQTAQLSPTGAAGASLSYTSDNPNVATVSGSGVVTAIGLGQAQITTTLTAASGTQSAATTVTVNAASITIAPSPVSVTIGGKQTLTATARDANGKELSGGAFTWTNDDPGIVRLSATSGNPVDVEGLKLGATSVRASAGNATGIVQVTVTRGAPASITVTLGSAGLTVGQTTTATAEVRDAAGNVLSDQTVSWSAGDTEVATVASTGARTATVTAVGAGSTDVTAAIGTVSGKAAIQVAEVPVATLTVSPTSASIALGGSGQVITAVPKDAQGNTLVGRTVTWSVTGGDTSVLRLSARSSISTTTGATITVTAAKVGGPVTITATSGKTANAQITVTPGAPASITVTLASPNLKPGQTTTATAVVKDAAGNTVPGLTVTWAPTGSGIATASSTGPLTATVTALKPGTSDIKASVSGVTGQATLQVTQNDPATVTVTPTPVTVQAGGATQTLSAAVKDAQGVPLSGLTVSWTITAGDATLLQMAPSSGITNASGVATTSVSGLKAGGPVTVTATSGGKTGNAQITVAPGAPASISVTPTTLNLDVGQSAPAIAVVKDAQGSTITTLPNGLALNWQSGNTGVATVNPTPEAAFRADVSGFGQGSTNVTARLTLSSGTITSNAIAVTVNPLPPANITKVSGDNSTCPVNTFDCSFTVKVTNANNQPVAGVQVDWTWPPIGCGTIDAVVTTTTDAQGQTTLQNCSYPNPGVYKQVATVKGTAISATFTYTQSGLVLTFTGSQDNVPDADKFTAFYDVTAVGVVASELTAVVQPQAGQPSITITSVTFEPTRTTPTTLKIVQCVCGLPIGSTGVLDVTVSSTTPGVAPVKTTLRWTIVATSVTTTGAADLVLRPVITEAPSRTASAGVPPRP